VIEIKKALKELHNGKAAGTDSISPEVMEVDLDTTANMLRPLTPYLRRYGWGERCQMIGDY